MHTPQAVRPEVYTGPARKGWTSLKASFQALRPGKMRSTFLLALQAVRPEVLNISGRKAWDVYCNSGRKAWVAVKCEIQPKAGFHTVFTPKLRFGVKVKSFHCEFTVRCKHLTLWDLQVSPADLIPMHHNSVVVHWNSQWNAALASQCSKTPQRSCGVMLHHNLRLWCSTCNLLLRSKTEWRYFNWWTTWLADGHTK